MFRRSLPLSLSMLAVGASACAATGAEDAPELDEVSWSTQATGAGDAAVPLETAVRVGGGSGVFLGEGRVLTNWHVCTDSQALVLHNDPADGSAPFREGAACSARRASCNPPTAVTFEGAARLTGQAVFLSRAVDMCIVALSAGSTVPATRAPADIALTPASVGQEVVVASYPGGARTRVVERCKVTRGVAPVRDPDRINPSNLVVPSIELDCKSVQHGSSGAPVFDAKSGALLGLIWTGVCLPADGRNCRGPVYVTAASAWQSEHAKRPVAERSQLDALLEDLGM